MARTGVGLNKGILKVGGLTIDTRIKVGSILWLQEKYDMDFDGVIKLFSKGKIKDVINLITALAVQHNEDMAEEEITKKIKQLDLTELTTAATSLTSIFETDAKNLKRPIKGNLQES